MKNFLAVITAFSMALALVGCGNSDKESASDSPDSPSISDTSVENSSAEDDLSSDENSSSEDDASVDELIYNTDESFNPQMWLLEDENGNSMYMLGSMHILNEADYPLPKKLAEAYDDCDAIAIECDVVNLSAEDAEKLESYLIYDDQTIITSHVSKEAFEAMKGLLEEYGVYNVLFLMYNPLMFDSLISSCSAAEAGLNYEGYDNYFIRVAMEDNKTIHEIEGIELQCEKVYVVDDEILNLYANTYIGVTTEMLKKQMIDLHAAWRAGTVEEYLNSLEDYEFEGGYDFTDEELAILNQYSYDTCEARNYHMADRAEELLAGDEKVLYIVGAAHFVGEEGLISLLTERGYTITEL